MNTPHLTIRHELPSDILAMNLLAREAFWNLYGPGCEEHLALHQLRQHPDYLPELSWILLKDDQYIGGIYFSRSMVKHHDGTTTPTLTFGPFFIHPDVQRQGYGRKLMEHALQAVRQTQEIAIVILGFPYHYQPYGFVGGKHVGLSMEDGNFYAGLQVLPIKDSSLSLQGFPVFTEALSVDPSLIDAFDQQFPVKEKKVLPHHEHLAFEMMKLDES